MFPQRKSPRLQGYDYAQPGTYFITICTHQRQHLFGEITDDMMLLNALGHLAAACWLALPLHLTALTLDAFVIMPNHMHGIVSIDSSPTTINIQNATQNRLPSISVVVNQYKAAVTKHARKMLGTAAPNPIWQPRFHDHIVRNQPDHVRLVTYIEHNPARWQEDRFNAPPPPHPS